MLPVPWGSKGSGPFYDRGHRGEDAGDIAPCLQAKRGSAVVKQVELDIPATTHELFFALSARPALHHAPLDNVRIDVGKGRSDVSCESEVRFPVAGVIAIVE